MAHPQLKLTYFDGPGRAELSRLTFIAGGVPFEDYRLERAAFSELKPTLPLGQVPVLDIDGVTYPQSVAIARYAAKIGGLQPEDPMESLKVDVIIETIVDVRTAAGVIRRSTPDEAAKAEKTKALLEVTIPKSFGYIEQSLAGKFVLGSKISLADLVIYDAVENSLKPFFTDFDVSKYERIAELIDAVKANERIAAYLAK